MSGMKLPTIQAPKYMTKIPSTGKAVEYRPFTVKEEKILLMANESKDALQMVSAIRDIVTACTFGAVDINKMTGYDFEFLFLQIRSKSVGETAELTIKCKQCEAMNPVKINLGEAKVVPGEGVEPVYKIENTGIGFTLREPKIGDISRLDYNLTEDTSENMNAVLATVIESVFDESDTYNIEDYSQEEVFAFIDSLPHDALLYIQKYTDSRPSLKQDVTFTCAKCKEEVTHTLEGLASFFS